MTIALLAVLFGCRETAVSPTTPRPFSDSTKPYFLKITLYPCPSFPIEYADIDIEGELVTRLQPGEVVVAYVDTGTYAVRATPNVKRSNAWEVVVSKSTGSRLVGFNCFN